MIPEEKNAAVTRALVEACGVSEWDEIVQITKGHAFSRVYRIVVRGSAFLLKLIMYKHDPTCHFGCMRAAAAAGLAPRVVYTNLEDQICITDFIETAALPMAEALVRLPKLLRELHALPPFPTRDARLNTTCTYLLYEGPARAAFFQKFHAANILAQPEMDELLAQHAEVARVYPLENDMVPCHNDLFKPDNILFDGERLWLVDWEAAFLNDRYAELAVASNLVANDDAEERAFLHDCLGRTPAEYELARFYLAQQLAHIFYAAGFMLTGSEGKPMDWTEPIPDFADLRRRMWAGEVDFRDSRMKRIFGRLHWQQLMDARRQSRFREARQIIAQRNAKP